MNANEPEATEDVRPPIDSRKRLWLILAVLVLLLFAWLLISRAMSIAAAEREGVDRAAMAFASAALPLLDLKSKNTLGDEATLQRVVDSIVSGKGFSFAGILSAQGRVVAASDRNVAVDSAYPDFRSGSIERVTRDGKHEVIYPVRQNGVVYGAVVLRAP